MSIKYIKLPIYSVAIFGQYIYFAGGGGGRTGIPNQIRIYHRFVGPEPLKIIQTDTCIIQNLTFNNQKNILICNANENIIVYVVIDGGKDLHQLYRFQADFSPKLANNSICVSSSGNIVMAGGEDMTVRFYQLGPKSTTQIHKYSLHNRQILSTDQNGKDLYVSTDNHVVFVTNLQKKQIVRTIFQDQLLPSNTYFRACFFKQHLGHELIFVNFKSRSYTYVTKQKKGKYLTKQISNQQCCQATYLKQQKLLGIASTAGQTIIYSVQSMKHQGKQNYLKSGVNSCAFSQRGRLLSGTSNCSYHVQVPSSSFSFSIKGILTLIFTLLLLFAITLQDQIDL